MAGCSAKNRECAGGGKWCIGGELRVEKGAKLVVEDGAFTEGLASSWNDLTDKPFGTTYELHEYEAIPIVQGDAYGTVYEYFLRFDYPLIQFENDSNGEIIEYEPRNRLKFGDDEYIAYWHGDFSLMPELVEALKDDASVDEYRAKDGHMPFLICREKITTGNWTEHVLLREDFPFGKMFTGKLRYYSKTNLERVVTPISSEYLPKGYAVADATADTVVDTLNALLDSLRQAGYLME